MKDVNDVISDLSKVYESLKKGEMDIKIASELNNGSGKIINAAKSHLAYMIITKKTHEVPFFDAMGGAKVLNKKLNRENKS